MCSYVVLLTELLGERGAHDSAADAGRGREVRLARLSPGGGQSCTRIHQSIALLASQVEGKSVQVLILVILSALGESGVVESYFAGRHRENNEFEQRQSLCVLCGSGEDLPH